MEERIEAVLATVRPALARHGGNVEFVAFDEATGVASFRFQGSCASCPLSEMTLKMGIESVMTEAIPEIREVIAVS